MNIKELLKFFRDNKRTARSSSWIKKTLFEDFKSIALPISQDNNLFTKKDMVFVHNFIADHDCILISGEIVEEAVREMMRGTRT